MNAYSPSGKQEIILSLGSNQGDRAGWLGFAARSIAAHQDISVIATSPIYKTEPVEVAPEFKNSLFLNAILICETSLSPAEFLAVLHDIEAEAGRTRTEIVNAPRTLDIDIVLFGRLEISTPTLTIPHPRALSRRFVLQPLADLRPELHFPGDEKTISQHLAELPRKPRVKLENQNLLGVKELAKWNYPF